MRYILVYEAGDVSKAAEHFPAHRARWQGYAEKKQLLMIGPLSAPSPGLPNVAALAVFTTRETAEEFAKTDPFVVHGVVSRWSIGEWKEALTT